MWTWAHAAVSKTFNWYYIIGGSINIIPVTSLYIFATQNTASAASTCAEFSDAMVLFTNWQILLDYHSIGNIFPKELAKNNLNSPCDLPLSKLPKDESL